MISVSLTSAARSAAHRCFGGNNEIPCSACQAEVLRAFPSLSISWTPAPHKTPLAIDSIFSKNSPFLLALRLSLSLLLLLLLRQCHLHAQQPRAGRELNSFEISRLQQLDDIIHSPALVTTKRARVQPGFVQKFQFASHCRRRWTRLEAQGFEMARRRGEKNHTWLFQSV